MKSLKNNKPMVFFVLAWVLTLNGSNILLDWIGLLFENLNLMTQSSAIPVIGLSLQILFGLLAILFAYLAHHNKDLRAMSFVAIAVNVLMIVNSLTLFLYAVASGKFSF